MFNNRKFINELESKNEMLQEEIQWLKKLNKHYKKKNEELEESMETKEDSVINLLQANKELSLANTYQEKQIRKLETENAFLEKEIQQLTTEKSTLEGKLDKVRNYCKMLIGKDIFKEGE